MTARIGPATATWSPDLEWWFHCGAAETGDSSGAASLLDRIQLFGRREVPHDNGMTIPPGGVDATGDDEDEDTELTVKQQDRPPQRKLYPAFRDPMTDTRLGSVTRARRIAAAWYRLRGVSVKDNAGELWPVQDVLASVYPHLHVYPFTVVERDGVVSVSVPPEVFELAHAAFRREARKTSEKAMRARARPAGDARIRRMLDTPIEIAVRNELIRLWAKQCRQAAHG